jgi:hypothetical protein
MLTLRLHADTDAPTRDERDALASMRQWMSEPTAALSRQDGAAVDFLVRIEARSKSRSSKSGSRRGEAKRKRKAMERKLRARRRGRLARYAYGANPRAL